MSGLALALWFVVGQGPRRRAAMHGEPGADQQHSRVQPHPGAGNQLAFRGLLWPPPLCHVPLRPLTPAHSSARRHNLPVGTDGETAYRAANTRYEIKNSRVELACRWRALANRLGRFQ